MEYQEGAVDYYIQLADAIEERFPDVVVDGVEVSTDNGSFQVMDEDGKVIFSGAEGEDTSLIVQKLEEAGFE